jgi:hypothetical protein
VAIPSIPGPAGNISASSPVPIRRAPNAITAVADVDTHPTHASSLAFGVAELFQYQPVAEL